jgi:deoxycytidine triphosphate deaminase
MILSRKELKNLIKAGVLKVNPFKEESIGPVGIDLTLDHTALDPDTQVEFNLKDTPLKPGQFVLINSIEYLRLPNYLAGKIINRTSVARLGLIVGLNADLVEPSFSGKLTFAIKNISKREIWLQPHLRIAQLTFEEVSSPEMEVKVPRYNYKNPEASDLCEEMV